MNRCRSNLTICHPKAICDFNGVCKCLNGYKGDGIYECINESNLTLSPLPTILTTTSKTYSTSKIFPPAIQPLDFDNKPNYPKCNIQINIIDNYGFDNNVRCHPFASCIPLNKNSNEGTCVCNDGYEGDGYTFCGYFI